jgi:hypothetical protein
MIKKCSAGILPAVPRACPELVEGASRPRRQSPSQNHALTDFEEQFCRPASLRQLLRTDNRELRTQ